MKAETPVCGSGVNGKHAETPLLPLLVPPSWSACRQQKAMLISNSLGDEFFCVMDFKVSSNKAKAIHKLCQVPDQT